MKHWTAVIAACIHHNFRSAMVYMLKIGPTIRQVAITIGLIYGSAIIAASAQATTRPPCGSDLDPPREGDYIVVPVGVMVLEGTTIQRIDYDELRRGAQADSILTAVNRASEILIDEADICLDPYYVLRNPDRIPTGGVGVEYLADCPDALTDMTGTCFSNYLAVTASACAAQEDGAVGCILGNQAESVIDRAGTALANNPPPATEWGQGRGYIAVFANYINDDSIGLSGTSPTTPVSYFVIDDRFNNAAAYGRTIAHEFGHTFGSLGHESDPDRLMTQRGSGGIGTTLTADERSRIRDGASMRSLDSEHDGWLDIAGDVTARHIDLSVGHLYIDDFRRELHFSLQPVGLFPDSSVRTLFEAFFDTDNDSSTGTTIDGFTGIERVLRMRLEGTFPFAGSAETELLDTTSGAITNLDPPIIGQSVKWLNSIGSAVPFVPSTATLQQIVPLSGLRPTATIIAVDLRSTDLDTGEADIVSFDFNVSDVIACPGDPGTSGVLDTVTPEISCPTPGIVECVAPGGSPPTDPAVQAFLAGATATDDCDVELSISNDAPVLLPLGTTQIVMTASDDSGNSASCATELTVEDTSAPVLSCNSPANIRPQDAPVSYIASAVDACDSPDVLITRYDCYSVTKKGRRIDKTDSCLVSYSDDTITISDTGGVGDTILWTIESADASGNPASQTCELHVVR
jgi:hypothetical protein